MDKETLIAIRDGLQPKFDEQTRIKTEAECEQYKLQGEYRLVNKLIDDLSNKATEPEKE